MIKIPAAGNALVGDRIRAFRLEKHQTKDITGGYVNGSLIPAWKDWEGIIDVRPEMVYVTTVSPGEVKGPHLHIIRHSYFVCVWGKVVFIAKDKDGKYVEIESSPDNPTMVEIPKNHASCHINISGETSVILALVSPAWRPENRDEHHESWDDYDWQKWGCKARR